MIAASIYSVFFSFIFFLGERVKKKYPCKTELSRKVSHILCGLIALSFPFYIQSHWNVLGLGICFAAIMLISKKNNLLNSIHGVERISYGSYYYPLAIYLLFILTRNNLVIYVISILVMSLADALAALIGRKYGGAGKKKSIEGSVTFFLVSYLCILIPLLLMTEVSRVDCSWISAFFALILTGVEAACTNGRDNLALPIITYFLLTTLSLK